MSAQINKVAFYLTGVALPQSDCPCRYPGCPRRKCYGQSRAYCEEHECSFDTCVRQVKERGRCARHAYCLHGECSNMRRQASAAKYCEEHATTVDYSTVRNTSGECIVCGEFVAIQMARSGTRGYVLCPEHKKHRELVKRLRYHGASDGRARELITGGRCWVCDGDVRWALGSYNGKYQVHIDHDHACCVGERSCGACIRGLAHDKCNQRLGFLEALIRDIGGEGVQRVLSLLKAAS